MRRSALKSTPLPLEVSGPPATAAAAAVPFAAAPIPFAAAAINVSFGLVAGRAGPLPALTLTLTFCGSSPDSGAVPGDCGVRAMASRARFDRSAFFRASKTMLNTVVPENTLCCGIYGNRFNSSSGSMSHWRAARGKTAILMGLLRESTGLSREEMWKLMRSVEKLCETSLNVHAHAISPTFPAQRSNHPGARRSNPAGADATLEPHRPPRTFSLRDSESISTYTPSVLPACAFGRLYFLLLNVYRNPSILLQQAYRGRL